MCVSVLFAVELSQMSGSMVLMRPAELLAREGRSTLFSKRSVFANCYTRRPSTQ